MPEQKLNRSEVPSPSVDQHRLRAAKRMSAKLGRVESDAGHPLLNKSGVLSRCQPIRAIAAPCEQELTRFAPRQPQVLIDRHSCLVGQLEPDRPTCLLLANRGAVQRVAVRRNIIDANGNDVTATQLAVDRQVEQCEVAFAVLDLQLRSDRPDVARSQGRLGTDELALVPRRPAYGFG